MTSPPMIPPSAVPLDSDSYSTKTKDKDERKLRRRAETLREQLEDAWQLLEMAGACPRTVEANRPRDFLFLFLFLFPAPRPLLTFDPRQVGGGCGQHRVAVGARTSRVRVCEGCGGG